MRVSIDDFEDGIVPMVCASSGRPAAGLYRIRLIRTPMWPLLLVLLGPLGWIAIPIACYFSRTTVVGYLPFTEAAQQRMRIARRHALQLAGLSAAVGVVLVINAAGYGQTLLGWAGLGSLVVALAFLWRAGRPPGSVGGRPEPGHRWVTVTSVSAEFAAAYTHQLEADRLARRQVARHDDQSTPDAIR